MSETTPSDTLSSQQSTPPSDAPAKKKQGFAESVMSLLFALLIVFMIRSSVFESFKIPSGSMIPTLAIGDYIFVNKFAYGFKIPFSDTLLDQPIYVVRRDPPKRGDVIVFRFPKDESIYFIKRVIGLPGDTIEMRDKLLYINNTPVPREAMPADQQAQNLSGGVLADPQYTVTNPDFYTEHLERADHSKVDHMMLIDKNNTMGRSFGPVTVPADSLFCMGDNRDVSNDSRYWGFVPMRNVAGRATFVWFSFWMVSLTDFQIYFHPSRIGTAIH